VIWYWLGIGVGSLVLILAAAMLAGHIYVMRTYLDFIIRIFQEKPLFIIPRGQPVPGAEDVRWTTPDGLTLAGCYLHADGPRQGVILFGLEFGSNRWSCVPYCEFLRKNGFDIFAFEVRGQGDSSAQPAYEPLQWVTDYEVNDFRSALAYVKARPDADPRGVGFFGISKGAGAGLLAAADDDYVRCFVTDGMFATHTTMVPYMRKWIGIYSKTSPVRNIIPDWYYGVAAGVGLRKLRRLRNCRFPHLERVMSRLAPRPLLMIHGGGDTYIKPEMAQALFDMAGEPKELWLVEGAKHNQAFHVANGTYQQRVLDFFQRNLRTGWEEPLPTPSSKGTFEATQVLHSQPTVPAK
jgi:alpha-beta hydrolase superfamily lysophospholipase